MSAFYVGQKVVCVEDGAIFPRPNSRWEYPIKKGGIYTVAWAGTCDSHPLYEPYAGVHLVEIKRHIDRPFDACRFAPLEEKPDAIEQFRKMCRDAEAGKLVDA